MSHFRGILLFVAVGAFIACGSSSSNPSGGGNGDGGPPGDPPRDGGSEAVIPDAAPPVGANEICATYVQCTAKTSPALLGTILETYGEQGSCFRAGNPTVCSQACLTGLRQARTAYPNERACTTCFSDAHCESAGKPACDTSSGLCVGCTADSHCPGGACDVRTKKCVGCNTDAHCSGATPACDVSRHSCVGCNTDAHCSGATPACLAFSHRCVGCIGNGYCPASTPICQPYNECCAPPTCEQIQSRYPTKRTMCGSVYSGCGNPVDCGTCAVGTCVESQCNNASKRCTPPGQAECAVGEICVLSDVANGTYTCGYDFNGETCSPGGGSNQCKTEIPPGTSEPQYVGFYCITNKCQQMCKDTNECQGGRTCVHETGRNWGYCVMP